MRKYKDHSQQWPTSHWSLLPGLAQFSSCMHLLDRLLCTFYLAKLTVYGTQWSHLHAKRSHLAWLRLRTRTRERHCRCRRSIYLLPRGSDADYAALKITTIFDIGKQTTTQADPRLNPARTMVVKPDADTLRLQLLLRGHENHGYPHGTKWLKVTQSENYWYSVRTVWHTFRFIFV